MWQWFNGGCVFTSCCRIPCPASPPALSSSPPDSAFSSPPSFGRSPALCRPVASRPLCERRRIAIKKKTQFWLHFQKQRSLHTYGWPFKRGQNLEPEKKEKKKKSPAVLMGQILHLWHLETHMDSSACFLASAACSSLIFSATWACFSTSLKLLLLTFWAPRPFLAPS